MSSFLVLITESLIVCLIKIDLIKYYLIQKYLLFRSFEIPYVWYFAKQQKILLLIVSPNS